MKQRLDWAFTGDFGPIAPPPRTESRDVSIDQRDAIVGGKGRVMFSYKWAMPYYFHIGAGDSDLTWQAVLGLTYSFDWRDIGAVWRYMDYHLKSNDPIKERNFGGPALGATFRW